MTAFYELTMLLEHLGTSCSNYLGHPKRNAISNG